MDYQQSGVDVAKGDEFVKRIAEKVKSTYALQGERVLDGVGGFAALFDQKNGKYLAAGTDGVGTKVKIAQALNKHDTIGIDLVAMCVNDVICTGANPLFFLDYLATGKLDLPVSEQIVNGIVEGCHQSGMALIGGETAEMPGVYQDGVYDLAGFCIGEVEKENLLQGQFIANGDQLVAIQSSGFHSNGFSLLRKLVQEHETDLLLELLTPTKIYVPEINKIRNEEPLAIKGLAHITGGGIHNIARINPKFNYHITELPSINELPPIFKEISSRAKLPDQKLYETFNMGMGMVIVTAHGEKVQELLHDCGQKSWVIGHTSAGEGQVIF